MSEQPPTIAFEGARLRPLRETDAAALYDYLRDPSVTELTSFPVMTPVFAELMIARARARWASGELSKWALTLDDDDDRIIGTCGFNDWSRPHRWAELAYDLAPAQWGRGVMGRAVTAVLRWVFEADHVDRVQAFVRVDNAKSERLLERSGFMREGCLRSYRICRGAPHDFHVYGLLRAEFER